MTYITSTAQWSTKLNQVIFAVLDVSWIMGLNSDKTSKVFCINELIMNCELSHTRTVVREYCKGDDASQWRTQNLTPHHAQTP